MARYKSYQEADVLEAATERVRHVYDLFDSVVVMFSGGKDSLVCVLLALDEARARGRLPLAVVFRDEELIPDSVVEFVSRFRSHPDLALRWLCYPMASQKFILGRHFDYVQWDPARPHVRPMPEWGERPPDPTEVYSQTTMDGVVADEYPGAVAFITGIRADESLVRYRSVVNKLNENYICGSSDPRVKLCKPIYDWTENDVFKLLHDRRQPWCPLYDAQNLDRQALRVSTPLHVEAAKHLSMWRSLDPDFYQRLMDVFPEMLVQERYWREFDVRALRRRYEGRGWRGCLDFIRDQVPDEDSKDMAMDRLREFRTLAKKQPKDYTPTFFLKALASGALKRTVFKV